MDYKHEKYSPYVFYICISKVISALSLINYSYYQQRTANLETLRSEIEESHEQEPACVQAMTIMEQYLAWQDKGWNI